MTVPTSGVTDHLLTYLNQTLRINTAVGDGEAPADVDRDRGYPYAILHEITEAQSIESLLRDSGEVHCTYQVTCVGLRRVQAGILADRVVAAMLADALIDVAVPSEGGTLSIYAARQVSTVGDHEGDVFTKALRFELRIVRNF